ncbi:MULTISPECIES: hypothetical protein [unclassified Microbacterium]|uniref:phage tail tube protein n=1 Tax=unclassified Microbacterium TaxID=2609290 RepID=UPI000EA8B429|nr:MULTISPECIES: hypothetical protein [unclassified Microbacterium]MBT2485813.1 hypothetical protein [Microbacterium sp. ISL-108]RKN68576.1 hypothetical protein D7252_13945 [Microbacterium sp. CGR2]
MSLTIPAGVPSMGTRRVVFIPGTVADIDAITVTEVTAGENVSCYIMRSSGLNKSLTQNKIVDSRYCSAQDFQRFGSKSKDMSLGYSTNLGSPEDDAARLALVEGTDGILVELFQVDEDSDTFDVGDWYQATPISLGEQFFPPVEDNAIDRITQEVAVSGAWTQLKQLVAGA